MTKILWHSNGPHTMSGYGQQTALFVPRLATLGHDIAISCFYGLEGSTIKWTPGEPFESTHTCYPTDRTRFGLEMLPFYVDMHAAGEKCLVLSLMDVWVMMPQIERLKELDWVCWTPVDHDPAPPMVVDFLLKSRARVIAMTRFGEDRLRARGLDPFYVPHGVDTSVFKPDAEVRKRERARRGIAEDAFVVSMVAANMGIPSRKSFPAVFEAFAVLKQNRPEAILYLHTDVDGHFGGVNLVALAQMCGIPQDAIRATPYPELHCGLPQASVAEVYQLSDVLAIPSMGEGFGIPLIEAQACGVPVITTNWTAMTELCGAGWLVEGDRWYDASQRSFFKQPAQIEIHDAMEAAYDARNDKSLRTKAREFALQYDADHVFEEYWKPTMEAVTRPREVPPLALKVAA